VEKPRTERPLALAPSRFANPKKSSSAVASPTHLYFIHKRRSMNPKRNLRGLGLTLNLPQSSSSNLSPPLPQQVDYPPPLTGQQHSFEPADDGYYYDETDDTNTNAYIDDYDNYPDEMEEVPNAFSSNDVEMDTIIDSTLNLDPASSNNAKIKPMIHPAAVNALASHEFNQNQKMRRHQRRQLRLIAASSLILLT
jgi:hypothetical protein